MYLINIGTGDNSSHIQLLSARPLDNGKPALLNHFISHYANLGVGVSMSVQGVGGQDSSMFNQLNEAIGPIITFDTASPDRMPADRAKIVLRDGGFTIEDHAVAATNGGFFFAFKGVMRWPVDITQGTVNRKKVMYLLSDGPKVSGRYDPSVVAITPDKWPVVVKEWFKGELQTIYGPFDTDEAAMDWCDKRKERVRQSQPHHAEYTWNYGKMVQPEAAA